MTIDTEESSVDLGESTCDIEEPTYGHCESTLDTEQNFPRHGVT